MKIDTLMSSLREMITADIKVQTATDQTVRDEWGLQYSRHERVVNTELQKLADLAERGTKVGAYSDMMTKPIGGRR